MEAVPQNTGQEAQHVCSICGEPVTPPYNLLRGRIYCDRHFAVVDRDHFGFWRSAMVQIIAMGVFSALVVVAAGYIGPLEDPWRLPVGIALVLVPTVLWVYYFYRQDRARPEPKTRILQVLLLALILTEAIGYPLVNWFQIDEWAGSLSAASLLASVLISGFVWQAITYAAVRVAVYTSQEFDERMDGIIYGTMAGLGVATLLNLHYVLDNGGVDLGAGVVHVVTTALAQASVGGIMGYFMAQAKFEHRPVWWIPVGVVIAAVLNGIFRWLASEVSADGLTVAPWRSLVLGLIVALMAFAALLTLMQRAMKATQQRVAGQ
ncbi:MAG TPA: PrsW family glutamic-type intramembrane protease [Chloroflexia bacterium]|nr:PrsW family glutamic-type intramembrane protease [Chloroflexia bacterium]